MTPLDPTDRTLLRVRVHPSQLEALHAEADRRGVAMQPMVREAIATLTGCPDPIRPFKRHTPHADDKRRDRSRYPTDTTKT